MRDNNNSDDDTKLHEENNNNNMMDLFKKYVFYVFCVFAMGIIDMFGLRCFFIP